MTIDATLARRNTVLGGLDEASLAALLPDLTETRLTAGRVLHEPGLAISEVYFPLLGVVSVVAGLGDDEIVETATTGRRAWSASRSISALRPHRTSSGAGPRPGRCA